MFLLFGVIATRPVTTGALATVIETMVSIFLIDGMRRSTIGLILPDGAILLYPFREAIWPDQATRSRDQVPRPSRPSTSRFSSTSLP